MQELTQHNQAIKPSSGQPQKPDNSKKPEVNKAKPVKSDPDGDRYTYTLNIQIGDVKISNLKGEILGFPFILLSTRQHSQIDFVLNDQTGALWSQIVKQQGADIVVEIGYPPNYLEKVLTGKAYRIGRKLPDGITIEVVDEGFGALSGTSGSLAQSTTEFATFATSDNAKITAIDQQEAQKRLQTSAAINDLLGGQPVKFDNQLSIVASFEMPNQSQSSSQSSLFRPDLNATPATPTPQQQNQKAAIAKLGEASKAATANQGQQLHQLIEKTATSSGLKFENHSVAATGQQGNVSLSTPAMKAAVDEAAKKGDVIVQEGGTVKQVGPGQGEPSGVTLDYKIHQSCFVRAHISKKTPLQLQSGFGAMTVQGWSVNDKNAVGATVVTQSPISQHPTGIIQAPEWGQIKLADPIFQGCLYTWSDATRNGERVPESKNVMKGIIAIAQVMMQWQQKGVNGGKRVEITSWYRDPATNMRESRSGASGPHTTGTAVDFWFPGNGLVQLHQELDKSWEGGVAIHPAVYEGAGFVHVDLIGAQGFSGSPRRRWSY